MTLTELNEIKANYKILEIAVDFINPSYNISRAKHLDNARYLICTLTENGIPRTVKTNEAARIRLQKPDRTYVYNDCDILEDGRIFITLTEQILAVEGNAVCDIQLTDEETGIIYSTKNFIINIDKTAVDNSIMESTNEFNALNNLIATNKKLNEELEANETVRQANENERIENENERQDNETNRHNAETERINAEKTRISNENIRQTNETVRQEQESDRENNTAVAITNAEAATKKANDAADDLQNKLNSHHFVLTEDKDIANGVPSLDSNTKIPINELYEATTTSKGITQLTDSVESTSTSTAATPNSVKIAYDKAASVENDINSNRENWNDKYTKNEVDNKFSTLETNVDWKESVDTYNDILTAYPNPDDGWTVNVKDTDYTYRFNGTEWVAISANAIPKATNNVDGLLSKEDKKNYDDANNKKHTHDNKSIIDKITQTLLDAWNAAYTHITDAVKHITRQERNNWNEAYTHSQSAHAPSNAEVNQNAFSNIAIDYTTIAADSKTDTLTLLAGDNITLSPDTENNQITISSTGGATSNALPLSGGNMTGNIGFQGTKATIDMIKFIDNTADANGNGISIGGGGLTIIGGGESSNTITSQYSGYSEGGNENMVIANDGAIDFYTNCQNGISSAKHITMNTDGSITADKFIGEATDNTKLPLTGGTVTGVITEQQGSLVHSANAGQGSTGYIHIATFQISDTYQNSPIVMELSKRGVPPTCTLYIQFTNAASTDPALGWFGYTGANYSCYMYKSATSTWDLYVQKSEAYDTIDVIRFHKPVYLTGVSVTWKNIYSSALPSGGHTAGLGGAIGTAVKLQTARNVKIGNETHTFDGSSDIVFTAANMGLAPQSHASTVTTYGVGNASYYGHVKLSDSYTSSPGSAGSAANGMAASSLAVYNTYNTFNTFKNRFVVLSDVLNTSIASASGSTVTLTNYSWDNYFVIGFFVAAKASSGGAYYTPTTTLLSNVSGALSTSKIQFSVNFTSGTTVANTNLTVFLYKYN